MKIRALLFTLLTSIIANSAIARNESINSALDVTLGEATERTFSTESQGKTVLVIENVGDYTGRRPESLSSDDVSNDLERDLSVSTTSQMSQSSDPAL